MFRRRANAAPAFRQPQPFNPITGKFSEIGKAGILSYCSMMQIIEDDTHDDYVVCRGFDPEAERFFHRISVAKPYGVRGTYPYEVAQIYPAISAKTRLGETPGKAADTVGHPADLEEEIEILVDDDGVAVAYILIDASGVGGGADRWANLITDLIVGGTCEIQEYTQTSSGTWCVPGATFTAYHPAGRLFGTGGRAVVSFNLDKNGYAALQTITCPNEFAQLCSEAS